MIVLLVGSGGRETALAWLIGRSPSCARLLVCAEHPGWPTRAEVHPASSSAEIVAVACSARADLVVVGPEAPLADGLADALAAAGVPCFGPTQAAARLESSKGFAKQVMRAAGVPTAAALSVDLGAPDELAAARARCRRGQVVVKADGLAAGKGVWVCPTPDQAIAALDAALALGAAGRTVLLEDLLVGPEVSLLALCDGERAVALPPARDHKRLLDADLGPNTGGMGAIAPCGLDDAEVDAVLDQVHRPVLRWMAAQGTPFRGVLYAGLMLTEAGPMVLEFNARFGDPECQALCALWADDPLPWLYGGAVGALPVGKPMFRDAFACVVVLASPGYPESATRGLEVREAPLPAGALAFLAGAARGPDQVLRTSGGRVLGVVGTGDTAEAAIAAAYRAVPARRFEGAQWRTDIGKSAI